jgi:chorismate-pyruvate lyase
MTTIAPTSFDADFTSPDPVQRLLLTTDGTLTELLEALNGEKICVIVLRQEIAPAETNIETLAVTTGEPLLKREVILTGQRSGDAYVYAQSLIAIERLDDRLRRGLLTTDVPLGKLLKKNRIETFKEVLDSGVKPSRELSAWLSVPPGTLFLFRSCCVSCNGKPVTLISEHVRYFLNQRPGSLRRGLSPSTPPHPFEREEFFHDTSLLAVSHAPQKANW